VGFAVNVAVMSGSLIDPMILANSMMMRDSPSYFRSRLPRRHHFSMTPESMNVRTCQDVFSQGDHQQF
jgi:hypothetical protein